MVGVRLFASFLENKTGSSPYFSVQSKIKCISFFIYKYTNINIYCDGHV